MKPASTQFRHERKFYLSPADAAVLRQRAGMLLAPDRHSARGAYKVSSLYFDDVHDTSLREKLDGVAVRDKWRVRWYNDSLSPIHLERKHKENDLGMKQHDAVTEAQFRRLEQGDMAVAAAQQGPVWQAFHTLHRLRCLRPVVVVSYRREALACEAGNVRLTFDADLRAARPGSPASIPVSTDGMTILEVKYDGFLPAVVAGLLSGVQYTQLAISKYVMARLTLMQAGYE